MEAFKALLERTALTDAVTHFAHIVQQATYVGRMSIFRHCILCTIVRSSERRHFRHGTAILTGVALNDSCGPFTVFTGANLRTAYITLKTVTSHLHIYTKA